MSIHTLEDSPPSMFTNRRTSAASAVDFQAFYQDHYRSVVGLGYVLSGDRNTAEDLAQEAFTEAHRRWADISNYDNPGAWVRRVMINRSKSRIRRVLTEAKTLSRLRARPSTFEELPERSEEIWAAVRALPDRQAKAVALRYWDDLGVNQIAEILECGPETVKTHLKRGRASLAEQLGLQGGEDLA